MSNKKIRITNSDTQPIYYEVWWGPQNKQNGELRKGQTATYYDTGSSFNITILTSVGKTLLAQAYDVPLENELVWASNPEGGFSFIRLD